MPALLAQELAGKEEGFSENLESFSPAPLCIVLYHYLLSIYVQIFVNWVRNRHFSPCLYIQVVLQSLFEVN